MAKWKVGITGGIGSGKTYCARIFARLGIPVYYADDRAKWLMTHDERVKNQLTELLGERTYDASGNLNKEFLRDRVFGNASTRKAINAIVHPAVGRDYDKWHALQHSPYTLKEAALLVESGSYRNLDHLIMVQAPVPVRIQRIMNRDSITADKVWQRMESQLPDADKAKVSDMKIDNSGCFPILPQVLDIHKKLMS